MGRLFGFLPTIGQEVERRRRQATDSLADLSGCAALANVDPPFVSSADGPRPTAFE
jgi:hypothetical protein